MRHFFSSLLKQIVAVCLLFPMLGMQSAYYQTHTTSFFKIKYERKISAKEAAKIGTMLENSYGKMRKKLNLTLNNRVDVFLYTASDRLQTESKSRLFDDAVYKNGKAYIVAPGRTDEEIVKRAVTRVVCRSILNEVKACPQWLAEAYSIYAGGDVLRFGQPSRLNVVRFADLAEDYSRAEGEAEVKEMYAKLGSTISFLVHRYGEAKVESLFLQFNSGKLSDEIFEITFGEKIGVIEKAWMKALALPIQE
jgi:hypothetical protein